MLGSGRRSGRLGADNVLLLPRGYGPCVRAVAAEVQWVVELFGLGTQAMIVARVHMPTTWQDIKSWMAMLDAVMQAVARMWVLRPNALVSLGGDWNYDVAGHTQTGLRP